MKVCVETERLIMREITESDADDLFELDSDPEVHRYLGNCPVDDIGRSHEVIKSILRQYLDFGIGRWAVIEKSTGAFTGWAGLKYELGEVNGRQGYFDLGYRLKKKFWGQGIATEAARASLGYGFKVKELDKICAAAHVENLGSNRVLIKVGMHFTETFKFEEIPCNWYEMKKANWIADR